MRRWCYERQGESCLKYSDEQRIEKILLYANQLVQYTKKHNITKPNVLDDYVVQWTVATPLRFICNHAYLLTQEFKDKTPQIKWNQILGLRYRLLHDFDAISWEIIADVVFNEIPVLIKQLQDVLK